MDCENDIRPGFKGSGVEAMRALEAGEIPALNAETETEGTGNHESWGE